MTAFDCYYITCALELSYGIRKKMISLIFEDENIPRQLYIDHRKFLYVLIKIVSVEYFGFQK